MFLDLSDKPATYDIVTRVRVGLGEALDKLHFLLGLVTVTIIVPALAWL